MRFLVGDIAHQDAKSALKSVLSTGKVGPARPLVVVFPSLSAPYLNFVRFISGLDIGSIRARPESSGELPKSSRNDNIASVCSNSIIHKRLSGGDVKPSI